MCIVHPDEDAFGRALLDHLDGRPPKSLLLETDVGVSTPAMPPTWFFEPAHRWVAWEKRSVDLAQGPVLDLGAGAGRVSLYLQQEGLDVTAVDNSPGAVDVCRRLGINDARLQDLRSDLPNDKRWLTVLLLCGNFGLAGGWDKTRRMLSDLHGLCAEGALIVADSVDPSVMDDTNVVNYRKRMIATGEYEGNVTLRLHYGDIVSPWWTLTNVLVRDVPRIIDGTGWALEDHLVGGADHYIRLRRQ